MTSYSRKLVREGPYSESFPKPAEVFYNKDILIVILRTEVDMIEGQHAHDSYEFLIPSVTMPFNKIENKVYSSEKIQYSL